MVLVRRHRGAERSGGAGSGGSSGRRRATAGGATGAAGTSSLRAEPDQKRGAPSATAFITVQAPPPQAPPPAPGSPPPAARPPPPGRAAARQPAGPAPAPPFPLVGSGDGGGGGARGPVAGSDWPTALSIAGEEAEALRGQRPWEQPGGRATAGLGAGRRGPEALEEGSGRWGSGGAAASARGGGSSRVASPGGPRAPLPAGGGGHGLAPGGDGSLGGRLPAVRAQGRMRRGRHAAPGSGPDLEFREVSARAGGVSGGDEDGWAALGGWALGRILRGEDPGGGS